MTWLKENRRKTGIVAFIFALILLFGFFEVDLIVNRNYLLNRYLNKFIPAINNQDCEKLYPSNQINDFNKNAICPRGDIGNFMVIDKVKYEIIGVQGTVYSPERQLLLKVCVEARGVAAWNQGEYKECTIDPRIILFKISNFEWQPNLDDFTNLSVLLSKAAEKPYNFTFDRFGAFPLVNGTIKYVIKTHKVPERGHAY